MVANDASFEEGSGTAGDDASVLRTEEEAFTSFDHPASSKIDEPATHLDAMPSVDSAEDKRVDGLTAQQPEPADTMHIDSEPLEDESIAVVDPVDQSAEASTDYKIPAYVDFEDAADSQAAEIAPIKQDTYVVPPGGNDEPVVESDASVSAAPQDYLDPFLEATQPDSSRPQDSISRGLPFGRLDTPDLETNNPEYHIVDDGDLQYVDYTREDTVEPSHGRAQEPASLASYRTPTPPGFSPIDYTLPSPLPRDGTPQPGDENQQRVHDGDVFLLDNAESPAARGDEALAASRDAFLRLSPAEHVDWDLGKHSTAFEDAPVGRTSKDLIDADSGPVDIQNLISEAGIEPSAHDLTPAQVPSPEGTPKPAEPSQALQPSIPTRVHDDDEAQGTPGAALTLEDNEDLAPMSQQLGLETGHEHERDGEGENDDRRQRDCSQD